ncbi:hypothetical protein DXG03_005882 [Asterophora parasitica]|uniref:Uncharacterized protein n=1 Tax=Asterophora parasitica TaxID=117018 RepID=A0A9P7K7D0_9AGAR|nr:hypothetical protein DXG03_005882 [Asterophora parasitica]
MSEGYSSDAPLEFPSSEGDAEDENSDDNVISLAHNIDDDYIWPTSHEHDVLDDDETDGPALFDRCPLWIPLAEEQEVEAESETDPVIRAEAKKAQTKRAKAARAAKKTRAASTNAVLRIRLPGRSLHDGSAAKTTTKRARDASQAVKLNSHPLLV